MQYHIRVLGNNQCIVNGAFLHHLDSFIQTLEDEDIRLTERGQSFAYNGE
jgi:hypothetical protein